MSTSPIVRSVSSVLARRWVTRNPVRAGLNSFGSDDVLGGRARGFACGGGIGSGTTLAVPAGVHCVVIGRTGCGKTRGVIEPNIAMNARHGEAVQPHIICLDCKGTILRETSNLVQREGYEAAVFDLAADKSPARWNPLRDVHAALLDGNEAAADIALSRLGGPLKDMVKNATDRYWEETAFGTICGVAKAISIAREHEPTLGEVYDAICDNSELRCLDLILGERSPSSLGAAVQLLGTERTWSCVRSTCASMLSFFATGPGRAVSSRSTVDFASDLLDSDRPRAFYIVVPDTSASADGYAGLLVNTLYQSYCAAHDRRGLEDTGKARPVMFILDEFARLPRMELSSAMSAGRSRGISVMIALQSVSQLTERGRYTPEEARIMLEQAAATIYLSSTSPEAGKDAELKSGGVVGARDLMFLGVGEAFVSVAGHPMTKTKSEPYGAWARAFRRAYAPEPLVAQRGARARGITLER